MSAQRKKETEHVIKAPTAVIPKGKVEYALEISKPDVANALDAVKKDVKPLSLANACCPNVLATLGLLIPPCWLGSCFSVREKSEVVVLSWGTYVGTIQNSGCHCTNACGRQLFRIKTCQQTLDVNTVKVADLSGNPMVISGNVTYQIINSKKAALDVDNVTKFISNKSLVVLKNTCAAYPFESYDGGQSLRSSGDEVARTMTARLQQECMDAGVHILQYNLTDMAYAPEIASAMLKRQEAEALVAARHKIVEGAVDIVDLAVQDLKKRGLPSGDQARMVSNLLVVLCSDTHATPTVSLS